MVECVGLSFDEDVMIEFSAHTDSEDELEDLCITVRNGVIKFGGEEQAVVGDIRTITVDFSEGAQAGLPLWEIFDIMAELDDFHAPLTESGGEEFKSVLFDKYAFDGRSSLLIIDRIEIKPEFRGRGLGLAACESACRHVGSRCDLVALKVYPLQLESVRGSTENSCETRGSLKGFPAGEREAKAKLQNYYMRMGFEEIASGILVRDPAPPSLGIESPSA